MKISSYMNNMNPIIEKNDAKVQKENKQANEKHTMEQSVKLSISNEGLEYYRNRIQQSGQEKYDDAINKKCKPSAEITAIVQMSERQTYCIASAILLNAARFPA